MESCRKLHVFKHPFRTDSDDQRTYDIYLQEAQLTPLLNAALLLCSYASMELFVFSWCLFLCLFFFVST